MRIEARPLVLASVLVALAGIVASQLLWTPQPTPVIEVLLAVGVVGELIRLPRRRGRAVSLSLAAVAAGAMSGAGPLELATLAAVSWVVQSTTAIRDGGRLRVVDLTTRVSGAVLLGVAVGAATELGGATAFAFTSPPRWSAVAVVWVAILGVLPLFDHLEQRLLAPAARTRSAIETIRHGLPTGVVVVAVATLGVLVYGQLSWATVPLMAFPLLAAKRGLDAYETMRLATSQTIRAMSRLPEHVGAVETGHGVRSGMRARSLASAMGLGADAIEMVERAAVLHAVGRLRAKDHPHLTDEEAARASVDIIRQAGGLDEVAAIVMASYEVSLLPELANAGDPDALLLAAGIVQASCRLDRGEAWDLVGDRRLPLPVRDVVMQLDAEARAQASQPAARPSVGAAARR